MVLVVLVSKGVEGEPETERAGHLVKAPMSRSVLEVPLGMLVPLRVKDSGIARFTVSCSWKKEGYHVSAVCL